MTWVKIATGVLFAVATLFVLARMGEMTRLTKTDLPGPRTMRRIRERALMTMGCWEISISVLMVVIGMPWTSAMGPAMAGLMMIGGVAAWRRLPF